MSAKLKLIEIFQQIKTRTQTTGGIVMSGTRDEILCTETFGHIHPNSKAPITINTLFDIQSITKVVATASLLNEFINQKKIHLDDFVATYIHEFSEGKKKEIKIKDLLLHQSGISDEDFAQNYSNASELWLKMLNAPIRYQPGSANEYTDVGYRILGLCLESIGKDNLDQLSKKFVWQKIRMLNTTYNIKAYDKDQLAGNGSTWGTVDDAQDRLLNIPLGCDGVFSTAQDLALFCQFLLKNLNNEAFKRTFFATCSGVTSSNWSFFESLGLGQKIFGWEKHSENQSYIGKRCTELTIEKAGGAGAFVCIRPEKNDFFLYLTNHGRPDPFSMEAWNNLVKNLAVRDIAEQVLNP